MVTPVTVLVTGVLFLSPCRVFRPSGRLPHVSVDLQVVFPQELVPLTAVRILPGVSPRSIDVIGQDFRSVTEVLINDVPSPDVVVVSTKRLLAQVPEQLANDTLTSVSVIASRLTVTSKSLIRFQVGKTPSKVSGILRLMQVFLKVLFTTPGTDIFSPRIGGNALKDIGLTFGKSAGGSITANFVVAVANTQRQIQAIQARDPSIPRDERLLTATVTQAGYNQAEAALVVAVELTSHAGRSATANLMV